MNALDVLRALEREPDAGEAFLAELEPHDRATVERALRDTSESAARRTVETMARALQGSLLDRHGDPDVAAAFRSRDGGLTFGTLPSGLALDRIVERHRPRL